MAPTTVALLARHGGVCDTPACHSLSQTLLTNTNLNIDPCSDFFQFSCKFSLYTHVRQTCH